MEVGNADFSILRKLLNMGEKTEPFTSEDDKMAVINALTTVSLNYPNSGNI